MTALALASYATEPRFREAVARATRAGRRIVGLWSPCSVELEGIGEAPARPIAPVSIAAGLIAAAAFYLFEWWSETIAYPFNTGNRPLHSWPVFVIAPIEFGALAAGVAGMLVLLFTSRLTRLHDAAFDLDEVGLASSEHFVIAVACDAGEDANDTVALLAGAGAVHSRLVSR